MPHGRGGNAADSFDLLGALIAWVEDGTAPQVVATSFREDNKEAGPNVGAARPLCPYPAVARFKGGDPRSIDNFACE